jgi:hypothetical protein
MGLKATYVLENSFSELLDLFEFIPFSRFGEVRGEYMLEQKEPEDLQTALEAWKKTIDVQQHFNELEFRIRNFAVTVFVAILGLAGIALQSHVFVTAFNLRTSLPSWILLVGLIGWIAFYFMDRFWYHPLLIGAVRHGESIEKKLMDDHPSIALTEAISKASPIPIFRWKIHSSQKIDLFYALVFVLLLIAIWAVH